MLGFAESQVRKLITREIIFAEFQRVWSQSTNVTDGRTDNLSWQYRATLYASRGAVMKKYSWIYRHQFF